jgi:cytochrome c peroxidase
MGARPRSIEQVLKPIQDPVEMDFSLDELETRIEVARTAPYTHDGSVGALEEVIEFYDGGGGPDPRRDADIRPLRLSAEEREALAAFLRSLGGS